MAKTRTSTETHRRDVYGPNIHKLKYKGDHSASSTMNGLARKQNCASSIAN